MNLQQKYVHQLSVSILIILHQNPRKKDIQMYVYWAAAQLKDKQKHQTKRQFKQLLLKLLEPGQKQTCSKRNSDTTIQGVKSKLNSENKLFMTLV